MVPPISVDLLVQLHEDLEIKYYVDHYAAYLITGDGHRLVLVGRGDGVLEAIADLERQAQEKNVKSCKDVRNLPVIEYIS